MDEGRQRRVAFACAGVVIAMTALAFAAVPLYSLFCQITGFSGTPRLEANAYGVAIGSHTVKVRFDANVAPGLNWRFVPETPEISVHVGEVTTVSYRIENTGSTPATGVASYNVQPDLAGGYFVKIACFCFTDTELKPGESREETVAFYVDPAIADDANIKQISTITLSYTFFKPKTASAGLKN